LLQLTTRQTNLRFPDPDFNFNLGFGSSAAEEDNIGGGKGWSGFQEGARRAITSIGDIEIGLEELNVIVEL